MSDYSGTPLWKKLGMKPGSRWAVVGAPQKLKIAERPDAEPKLASINGALDGAVLFVTAQTDLDRLFDHAVRHVRADAGIWIAWPKKSSKIKSALDFTAVQRAGLSRTLVDNKVCSIDEDWTALRFVVRKEHRANWLIK